MTPYEIRHRRRILPPSTLHPLNFVFGHYKALKKEMTIMQVGACDGAAGDPIVEYILLGGTRAVLIEPNPEAFALLQKTYENVPNVSLIQTAIGEQDGEAHLYRVRDGALKDGAFRGMKLAPDIGPLPLIARILCVKV